MGQLYSHLKTIGTASLYRKGASLFFQGEVPRQAIVVLDGVVKAYSISPEGEEIIVALYGRGSILPLSWISDQSPTALFNYSALSDVRSIKVKKSDFLHAIDTNPAYQKDYLNYVSETQASLLLRITGLCQSRATEKICYTLYYLLFRYGIEKSPGTFEIDLRLTQGMIANLIGQTRESTAKNLKILREAGVVDYDSSTYVVHKTKLESYLGEDAFRNLAI